MAMPLIADPWQWAEHTFGSANLGRAGRAERLVDSAARIAAQPEKSFTQIFDWNQLRAFYRLCDKAEATLQAVQQPHWQQTYQAMALHPLVLIVHDTTELDFTSHHALTGAGPIGDDNGRGFLQHNSLAVLPAPRQLLGLAYQQWYVRRPAPADETATQRKTRARESDLWRDGFAASGQPPEGCCWVDVADRAGDDYEAIRVARRLGHHVLLRATQNRLVFLSREAGGTADVRSWRSLASQGSGCRTHLLDHARSLPPRGSDEVEIPGRGGRPGRTATVCLAGGEVWLPAPMGTPCRRSQPVYRMWLIRIWEPSPPAGVDEPLEWVLICSLPTATLEELKERRDWYCCRWLAEVYHDVEKNGCREEDRRFETAGRMETAVAILAVVAVRVLQLRLALQAQPEAVAEQVATGAEIDVLRRWLHHPRKRFTVRDFVRGVARLGGFLGRNGDGEPGVRSLWRGYQRLQDMLVGYQLHDRSPPGYQRQRHLHSPTDFP
jgi:hypothetical protein